MLNCSTIVLNVIMALVSSKDIRPHAPIDADYQLIWHDEFDDEQLDSTKWIHRQLGPRRGAVNVKEAVTSDRQGHLRITTTRHTEPDGSTAYHTGMIGTEGKFETTFGYFEARVKVQSQIGHWCAFWLQTPTFGQPIGEPRTAGVEIDIFEYLCNDKYRNQVQHAIHWDGYGKDHKSRHTKFAVPNIHEGFHILGVEWTPTEYVFFVDGKETWRIREAISQRSQYIILSMEVDTWAGDIQKAKLPDSVVFDYVRVFQHINNTSRSSEGG